MSKVQEAQPVSQPETPDPATSAPSEEQSIQSFNIFEEGGDPGEVATPPEAVPASVPRETPD